MKYLIAICCIVLLSCNNDSSSSTTGDSTQVNTNADSTLAIEIPSCYAHQTSNNLVMLKLNSMHPQVSGELTYAIMGKDKNEGTIKGNLHGDTLMADYTFTSEGIESVRQVAFVKRGDAFVEGFGDVQQKGDTVVFSNLDSLNFNGTMILEKIPCTDN